MIGVDRTTGQRVVLSVAAEQNLVVVRGVQRRRGRLPRRRWTLVFDAEEARYLAQWLGAEGDRAAAGARADPEPEAAVPEEPGDDPLDGCAGLPLILFVSLAVVVYAWAVVGFRLLHYLIGRLT